MDDATAGKIEGLQTDTERRLYVIFQEKWRKMSNAKYRKGVVSIQCTIDAWESYMKSLGVTFLTLESSVLKFRKSIDPSDKNHYVIDPISLNPTYIVVPDELATKILALGLP